jgi:hypothetical protein
MLRKHGNKALTQPMSYSQGTGLRAIVNHESICSTSHSEVNIYLDIAPGVRSARRRGHIASTSRFISGSKPSMKLS